MKTDKREDIANAIYVGEKKSLVRLPKCPVKYDRAGILYEVTRTSLRLARFLINSNSCVYPEILIN